MTRAEVEITLGEFAVEGAMMITGISAGVLAPPPLVDALFRNSLVTEEDLRIIKFGIQLASAALLGGAGFEVGRFMYGRLRNLVKPEGVERFSWRKALTVGGLATVISMAALAAGELVAPSYLLFPEYPLHEAALAITGISLSLGAGAAIIGGALGEKT